MSTKMKYDIFCKHIKQYYLHFIKTNDVHADCVYINGIPHSVDLSINGYYTACKKLSKCKTVSKFNRTLFNCLNNECKKYLGRYPTNWIEMKKFLAYFIDNVRFICKFKIDTRIAKKLTLGYFM